MGRSSFKNGGFYGVIEGTATIAAPNNVSASGTADLLVNSGSTPEQFVDPIQLAAFQALPVTTPPTAPPAVNVPAGPIVSAYLEGVTLHLSSTQTVTGNFGFAYSTDMSSNTVVAVTGQNISATFGSTVFSNASANLTITTSGISGSVSGTVAFSGGGVTVTSGALTATVSGSSYGFSGTNVVLTVLGQQISGSFAITASAGSTTFGITSATLLFGNGLLSVGNLSGSFTVSGGATTGTVSGSIATSIGSAAFAGNVSLGFSGSTMSLSGTSDTLTVGDQSVAGNFSISQTGSGASTAVSFSATGVTASLGGGVVTLSSGTLTASIASGAFSASVSGTVSAGSGMATGVSFSGTIAVSVSPTAITATGTNDSLIVASHTFAAGFSFSEDQNGLELGLSGVSYSVPGGALSFSNGTGNVLIPADKSGVKGSVSAAFTSTVAHFSGQLEVDFGGGSYAISATGVSLTVGNQSISGDMTITVNGSTLDLTATDLTASLGGGLVTIGPPPAGSMVPADTLTISSGGQFSGSFSGEVTAGSATGVGFSGLVSVTVDTTNGISASGTNDVLTVAGQSITASFSFAESGGNLQLTVSGAAFSLGSVLSVNSASGTLNISSSGVSGSASGTVNSQIANLSGTFGLSFSPGVFAFTGTGDHLSYGDQIDLGRLHLHEGRHRSASFVEQSFRDAGPGRVGDGQQWNGIARCRSDDRRHHRVILRAMSRRAAALTTAGVGFSGQLSVSITAGAIQASGMNDTLTILGQTFNASFKFFEDANGLELNISGLSFSLGGLLSVAGASGTLLVNNSGISGSTAGSVTSTLVGFSGTLGITFGSGQLLISGTNDTFSIGDESLAGNFTFTQSGSNVAAEHHQPDRIAGGRAGENRRRHNEYRRHRQPDDQQRTSQRQLQRIPFRGTGGGRGVQRGGRRHRHADQHLGEWNE